MVGLIIIYMLYKPYKSYRPYEKSRLPNSKFSITEFKIGKAENSKLKIQNSKLT